MRVIIAGTRSLIDYTMVVEAIRGSGFEITEVLSGCASGADTFGENWARIKDIPVRRFPADWGTYGLGAGPIRNGLMVREADALIAVWDGKSRGTGDVINKARTAGLRVYVQTYRRTDVPGE